jgi:hypothetical protein
MGGTMLLDELASLYPLDIDLGSRLIFFTRMSRDKSQRSSFLDRKRLVASDAEVYTFHLDDVLLHFNSSPDADTRPTHYILHGAFCCSTLLARYLELMPRCRVLKEPSLLTQVTRIRYRCSLVKLDMLPPCGQQDSWLGLLRLCLNLYARANVMGEILIIKGSDICTGLGEVLLREDKRSRIVLLSTDLRSFLLSTLKSRKRREFVRGRLKIARENATVGPILARIDLNSLSDAQAASCLWMCNSMLFYEVGSFGGARVSRLDAEQVAEAPVRSLGMVANALQLPIEAKEIAKMDRSTVASRYSKDLSRPYDAGSRRAELVRLEARLSAEADIGMEWASRMNGRFELDREWDHAPYVGIT